MNPEQEKEEMESHARTTIQTWDPARHLRAG
jgi:hypothetical protein